MNWDLASQVATSLGALLAALSLAAGFLLYRINRRDELAAQFRRMIGATRPGLDQLQYMVSFELASELAGAAVYSRDLELPLHDVYAYARPDSGEKPDDDEVVEYLAKRFPVITIPLNTPLVERYQGLTASIAAEVAVYQATFPGIYRIVSSVGLLFEGILFEEKTKARDEDRWEEILPGLLQDEELVSSLTHMKWMLVEIITTNLMSYIAESRTQVLILTKMIDLVIEAYLSKTARELRRISRIERKEKIKPFTETKSIAEDLQEAERCLAHALSATQQRRYRELLEDFRRPPPSDGAALEGSASAGAAGAGGPQAEDGDRAAASRHDSHLAADDG